MEKSPRDNLRILGTVELFVVVLAFLFTAWIVTQTRQQDGAQINMLNLLKVLLPVLFILTVLGLAALSGKRWGFSLAVIITVLLFVLAVIQTRLVMFIGAANGLEKTVFMTWPLAFYHVVLSILYWKYQKKV